MDRKLSKHQVNILASYIEHVGQLLEALAMDDTTSHMIDEDIEDEHFQLRYLCEELMKREE